MGVWGSHPILSMPYTITQVGDEHILIIKLSDPFDFRKEPPAIRVEILNIVGKAPGLFFSIFDVHELRISLDDIMDGLANAAYPQGDPTGVFQKYGRLSLVGANPLIRLVVESANRFVPSSGVTRAFNTIGEALEYARVQIAGSG